MRNFIFAILMAAPLSTLASRNCFLLSMAPNGRAYEDFVMAVRNDRAGFYQAAKDINAAIKVLKEMVNTGACAYDKNQICRIAAKGKSMSITLQDIPIINRRSEEQLVNIDDAVTILKSLKENDLCKLEKPDALDLTFTDFKETAAVAINGKAASSYMEPQKAKEYLNKILPLFSDGATVESPNQEMVKKISNATN